MNWTRSILDGLAMAAYFNLFAAAQFRNPDGTCFRQTAQSPVRQGGMGIIHAGYHALAQKTFRFSCVAKERSKKFHRHPHPSKQVSNN